MKKSKGIFLFSGTLGLFLFLLFLLLAAEGSRQGLKAMEALQAERELNQAAGNFRARVETFLLYQTDFVKLARNEYGSVLTCYCHGNRVERSYYLSFSKTDQCRMLMTQTRNNGKNPGPNPLTPKHLEAGGLEITEQQPGILYWQMELVHRLTGRKKIIREVFAYGTG